MEEALTLSGASVRVPFTIIPESFLTPLYLTYSLSIIKL